MRRDLRTSNKVALGRYLTQINWPLLFTPLVSYEEKWQVFQDVIHSGLDTIMPAKPVKIYTADVPWMNESLISLIMKRQKAFCAYGPDSAQFKYFRNLVNRQSDSPEILSVTEQRVQRALDVLNSMKACGPDRTLS